MAIILDGESFELGGKEAAHDAVGNGSACRNVFGLGRSDSVVNSLLECVQHVCGSTGSHRI